MHSSSISLLYTQLKHYNMSSASSYLKIPIDFHSSSFLAAAFPTSLHFFQVQSIQYINNWIGRRNSNGNNKKFGVVSIFKITPVTFFSCTHSCALTDKVCGEFTL